MDHGSGKWLRLASEDFFGPCLRARNGRFVLAWRNADVVPKTGEVTRPGRFLLIDGEKVCVRGDVRRVLTASIAETGVFLIACGPQQIGDQQGTVYLIAPEGEILIKHRVGAWLGSSGISDDGDYAVCQATLGESPDEGGKLHFFDVEARSLAWKKKPETGWASRFELDTGKRILVAYYGGPGREHSYRYSFDGRCLDLDPWSEEQTRSRLRWLKERAAAHEILNAARRRLAEAGGGPGPNADQLLELLRLGLERPGSDRTHDEIRGLVDEIAGPGPHSQIEFKPIERGSAGQR